MLKFLAHDTVNDIAVIQTSFGYYCRYGLQVSARFNHLSGALDEFNRCQRHALSADLEGAA
jgi:hypothetical protein